MMKNNYYLQLKKLLKKAVCPLTKVSVAAIIVTDKGTFSGVNYEDIICPLSMCAERVAIYSGITNGMKRIDEIHIMSNIDGITMCGACRQLAASFATNKTKVYAYNINSKKQHVIDFGQLLPNTPVVINSKK